MKILESAENYLETILQLTQKKGFVRSVDIANELNFSKPSVSVAMKNLRENGYLKVSSEGLITLTDKGLDIANTMNERHVLLRDWLISLGVDKKTAANDACRIEHVISEETFEAIKQVANSGD
jgi:Mn-dependent DtxR family transcriptional regulator